MKRLLLLFAMFVAVAPLAALPEPTPDELQANRRRFEQLRKHPEVVAKLRTDAEAFFKLPTERRRQIYRIHKELHQESATAQARLHNVLDRYVDWLETLDKTDKPTRKKLEEAKDKNERLTLIKELRERQWVKDQPKAIQEKIAALKGDERAKFIAKEKEEERLRRLEWAIASRFWNELENEQKGRRSLPTKTPELPIATRNYVENYLKLMFLSAEEKDQLAKTEGQWPQYPMKLVELADRHPPALPGAAGPKNMAELPPKVLAALANKLPNPKKVLKEPIDKQPALLAKFLRIPAEPAEWPRFGIELAKAAKTHGVIFEHEFLAYNYECLTKPMQDFMANKLEPVLDPKEVLRLSKAKDKGWPDFPQTIQDLANNHHLRVPWFILPRDVNWNNYRLQPTASFDGFPAVPYGRLRDFALFELDPAQRAKLRLSADDPDSKRRLADEFFRARPFELRKLRAADQNRGQVKGVLGAATEKGE